MTDYILCSKCNKKCPYTGGYKKRYFTTTQYGGSLCSIDCCVAWITICKIKKVTPSSVDMSVAGTFTTVFSKSREPLKISTRQ